MLVKDLMAQQVATVGPEEPVSVAARALSRNNVGCLPVCTADGRLRGVVTDRDIVLRSVAADEDAGQQLVREIMSRRLVTAAPEDPVALAVHGGGPGAPPARHEPGPLSGDAVPRRCASRAGHDAGGGQGSGGHFPQCPPRLSGRSAPYLTKA